MTKIYLIGLLTLMVTPGLSQALTGKIFELGGEKHECKVFAECDCCTSELFLINGNQFALLDYCTFEHVLTTGTYKIESNVLKLTFKQVTVTNGTDEEGNNPYLKKKTVEIKPVIFSIGKCDNNALMLENKEFNEYKFGLRKDQTVESQRIVEFLKTDEWKLIIQ